VKIIIVGPAYPYRGGIADTNQSFAESLQKLGHEVSLITFKLQYPKLLFPGKTQYSKDPAPEGLQIHRLINSINPFNWWVTSKQIKKQQADLIIFRYWTPFLAPCLGSIATLIGNSSLLLALCDNIIPHEQKWFDRYFTAYFVRSFQGFITFSRQVGDELKTFTTAPQIYLAHPINLNLGEAVPKQAAKEKLKLSNDYSYLLFFGLVRKYKGLDLMIKAMAETALKDLKIKLLVVGEFYDEPQEYYDLIEYLGLKERVEIHNEFIPTEQIKYYFSACELITQTYHTASQSGISQLAYNFNKSILVTNVGGLSEIVLDRKTGYVVDKSPASIAEAIADFYQNNRANGFSMAVEKEKEKYSWKRFSEKTLEFAQSLMSDSKQ